MDRLTKNIPVILITYNRPYHTQKVLTALKENQIKNLYVFSDGPQNKEDESKVSATRKVINDIDWIIPTKIFRSENIGLAKSIRSAANLVFEKYDKLVLLEDDCVPGDHFFEFIEKCLKKYENNETVFGVTGYTIPIENEILNKYKYDLYFFPRIGSWGWATWKSRWEKLSDNLGYLKDEIIKHKIDIEQGGGDIPIMVDSFLKGELKDVWTLNWILTVYLNKGVYIYPTKSHIKNIGMDGSGIHCGKTERFDIVEFGPFPERFPDQVFYDTEILKIFYSKHGYKMPSVLPKCKNELNAFDEYRKIKNNIKSPHFLKMLNLGCGTRFHKDWINLDFKSNNPMVKEHNLLSGIPFDNDEFDVVYHSHLLEHFPKKMAPQFLNECFRVLKSGGIIRIAVPDLEQIAKNYIKLLEEALAGNKESQDKYEWIILEMFDQMVRNTSGGEMVKHWSQQVIPAEDYIYERFGSEARDFIKNIKRSGSSRKINENTEQLKTAEIGQFRLSGEIHQWMYDRYSLKKLLSETGFKNIRICSADESLIPSFNNYLLDIEADGSVRKPDSLFMEGEK